MSLKLKRAEIELEVLTPMFSYGNNQVEFRLTELKSLMRSAFREIYNFDDIKDMKEKEENLFGSTEKKSPVCFFNKNSFTESFIDMKPMLPHKSKKEYPCIKAGYKQIFYVICKNNKIDFYINLLLQSSVIGALGKRSRKGFGSFKINSVTIDKDSEKKYNDLINKNPIELLRISTRNNNSKNEEMLQYDKFPKHFNYPYVNKINIIKIGSKSDQYKKFDYMNLIEEISQLTHDRIYDIERQKQLQDSLKINKDIEIYDSILGNFKKHEKVNRFASPVYVSFWENNKDIYMIIKELNYDYIFKKYKKYYKKENNKDMDESELEREKELNKVYVDSYVQKLIQIGKGKNNMDFNSILSENIKAMNHK